jgi:polyisoprenoid-binding protein YceI
MHGVTKEATLEVEGLNSQIKDQRGNLKAGASATTKLNRRDFGLTWNRALEAGGVTVGDEVGITIDVELIKKMAQESSTAPPASAK